MEVPRVEEWSAAGNPSDGTGFISYERVPLHWWLLHRWLEFGHPHWDWWHRLWQKLSPRWGDPLCASYIAVWLPFYQAQAEDHASVDVGWDRLPPAVRSNIRAALDAHEH